MAFSDEPRDPGRSNRYEHDTVNARQRARQVARLLGFDSQDQTRIATAVSEIARNAFNYAHGGKIEFLVEGRTRPQLFVIKVSDHGSGIPTSPPSWRDATDHRRGWAWNHRRRRLMDRFQIDSVPGIGTTVQLTKLIPEARPSDHGSGSGTDRQRPRPRAPAGSRSGASVPEPGIAQSAWRRSAPGRSNSRG